MVSLASLASVCLVPSPHLAQPQPEEDLEACSSLPEAPKQAGWGFGQAGWKLPSSSSAPRPGSASVWVESLLLGLAVTTLWLLSVAKAPCEGRVDSPGLPSSSLEERWVRQPAPYRTREKKQKRNK